MKDTSHTNNTKNTQNTQTPNAAPAEAGQAASQVKSRAVTIISIVLVISLVLSIGFALVRFIQAPAEAPLNEPYVKLKTDYLLMLVQCLLGLLVMVLPSFLEKRFKIVVPNAIVILYYIFLYCAIYLGEVRNFYYVIPHWDTVLHAFSGAMLGAVGFILVDFFNKDVRIRVSLSPFFVAMFAFCFALAAGAVWEIYEFSFDALLGLNMQKHTTEAGVALIGHEALVDTMKDIVVDALAALAVAVIGYQSDKRSRKKQSAKAEVQA